MAERVYTIPLKKVIRSPRNYRARKAMNLIEEFLERHLKSPREKIKIGQSVNEALWSKGMKKPPRRIKVEIYKEDEIYRVELFGYKPEEKKEEKIEEKKEGKPKEKEGKIEKKEENKSKES